MSSQDRLQKHRALSRITKGSGIGDPKSTGLGATNLLTVSLDQADSTISSESKVVRPDPKTTSASHSRQTSASDAFAHTLTANPHMIHSLRLARGCPGVGTHPDSPVPRVHTHSESPGVPDSAPPRTGVSVMFTRMNVVTIAGQYTNNEQLLSHNYCNVKTKSIPFTVTKTIRITIPFVTDDPAV
jgi:hypothetical protein